MTDYPSSITLELRARHFEGTHFCKNGRCAIEKAMDETRPELAVREQIFEMYCGPKGVDPRVRYDHDCYGLSDFYADKIKALRSKYDDTVIRTIELKKA